MKCIVELINELKGMDDLRVAERFDLASQEVGHYRKIDFDNWLRRCLPPSQEFVDIDEAWSRYDKSFG